MTFEKLFAELEAKHIVCECKNPECVYKKNFLKLKEKYLRGEKG